MAVYCPRCTHLVGPGQAGAEVYCRYCRRLINGVSAEDFTKCPYCSRRYFALQGPCKRCNLKCDNCGARKHPSKFPQKLGPGTARRRNRGRICHECLASNDEEASTLVSPARIAAANPDF